MVGKKASIALRGRRSRFKPLGNSRVPLTESMEKMASLISNDLANEVGVEEQEEMDSTDGTRSLQ